MWCLVKVQRLRTLFFFFYTLVGLLKLKRQNNNPRRQFVLCSADPLRAEVRPSATSEDAVIITSGQQSLIRQLKDILDFLLSILSFLFPL